MLSVTALRIVRDLNPRRFDPSLVFEASAFVRSANYPLLTFANICQHIVYRVFLNKVSGR